MAAVEALKANRSIQFNISLDEKSLMHALKQKPAEDDDDDQEEKEGPAVRLLRKLRSEKKPNGTV